MTVTINRSSSSTQGLYKISGTGWLCQCVEEQRWEGDIFIPAKFHPLVKLTLEQLKDFHENFID